MIRIALVVCGVLLALYAEQTSAKPEACLPYNTRPVCADLRHEGGLWSASWYSSGRSCTTLAVRSFDADGTKRQSFSIRDWSYHHARIDGCVRDEVGWWGGIGWEVPDQDGAYYVLRALIWKAPRVYEVYASSDGLHSTAREWIGSQGNFDRLCLDPSVGLFAEEC